MDFLTSFDIHHVDSRLIFTAVAGGLAIVGFAMKVLRSRADDVDRLKRLPGAHWLWGHEREAWETPNSEWYIRNTNEHGLVLSMKGAFFHPDILAISDPAALHHICTHSHRFIKSTVLRPWLERLLGRGLTWAEGSEHTRQRQLVGPYFTAARVKQMDDDVQASTEIFINKFRQHILADPMISTTIGLRLNVMPWLTRPTLDIIGRVAMGHDFGCGESMEAREIHDAYKKLITMGMTLPAFIVPLAIRAVPWIGSLPFGIDQAQGTVKTIVKGISRNIVDAAAQGGADEVHSRNDLLGKLITTTDASNAEDVDMMLDQVCVFVMAGHETTTTTLSMTLLELARKLDIQHSLREEIAKFGGSGPSGTLSYEDVSGPSFPLLDAVCKEGLRMWPVGSHLERMASEDEVIPLQFPLVTKTGETLNAIRVQKGQVFYFPTIAINSNKQVWGDGGRNFDPYRWIEPGRLPPSSNLTGGINGHFSFLEGPRLCVGYRLAIFEFKVILSSLIRNFEFKTTNDSVCTTWATTLQPYVDGQKETGAQLPLFVKPLDT